MPIKKSTDFKYFTDNQLFNKLINNLPVDKIGELGGGVASGVHFFLRALFSTYF